MSNFADILACPRCDQPLEPLDADNGFRCAACQQDYPSHAGVPWLVADPAAARTEWRNRWQMALADLAHREQAAREALGEPRSTAARSRLETLADGYRAQHQALQSLLSSLAAGKAANLETYLALKTRLPGQMGLTSYQANVFRDWHWGDQENAVSLEAVVEMLPASDQISSVLVLGAGAGRLAWDLHQRLNQRQDPAAGPCSSVALEINPYLTTLLKRLSAGDVVTLTEFPLAPVSGSRSAIARELRAPAATAPGFQVILADALRAPFRPESFDVVLTPWLIDVIDAPLTELLARINALLRPDGCWVSHGSVAFNRPEVAECLGLDEVLEVAADCGFEKGDQKETTAPYLDCPDSRHGRVERIVTISARKARVATIPPRHQNLPDWIARGREPVPALPAFQQQAMATRIHAFIMSLIDGKRSLKDMAAVLESQQLMAKDDAEIAIRGFLIKMLEEARSGRGLL